MAYVPALVAVIFSYWILKIIWKVYTYIRTALSANKVLQQFPAEPSHWFLGHLTRHPGPNHEGLMKNVEWVAKYPRCYILHIGPLRPCLQLNHPDVIKEVMRNNQPKQTFGGGYTLFRPLMGDSIFLSTGAKWKRNHKTDRTRVFCQ